MKKNILQQFILLAVIAVLAASFSSCNKGYGCPNNFKALVQTAR